MNEILDKVTEPKLILTTKGNEGEIIEPFRLALKHFSSLNYEKREWYGDNDEGE